jgi:hypothetical protein
MDKKFHSIGSKARAYTKVVPLKGALLALTTKIRKGPNIVVLILL